MTEIVPQHGAHENSGMGVLSARQKMSGVNP